MENNYKVTLAFGDKSFTIESTDKAWLEKKVVEFVDLITGRTPTEPTTSTAQPSSRRAQLRPSMTVQEFYKKYIKPNKLTSRPDMAVHFIYYLTKIVANKNVKTADVEKCFADISYPSYNELNFADILNQAKRKALLNKIEDNWSLTITGEDFVLSNLSPDKNG